MARGAEQGASLEQGKVLHKRLGKTDPPMAGALGIALRGALWGADRLEGNGCLHVDRRCPCGQGDSTVAHQSWQCSLVEHYEEAQATQQYKEEALASEDACFWEAGLVPNPWSEEALCGTWPETDEARQHISRHGLRGRGLRSG